MFDAEPDLGGLLAGVLLYERAGKLELRVALERAREDQFGRAAAFVVAVAHAPMPLRLADADPVSGAVDRAAVARPASATTMGVAFSTCAVACAIGTSCPLSDVSLHTS